MAKESIVSIAKRLGLATSTVSRVLSGDAKKYRIADATVERIKNEAKQCGYVPSLTARGLRTSKSNIIGLIVPNLTDVFFSTLADSVMKEAKETGYTVVVTCSGGNEEAECSSIISLISRGVDGILLVPCGTSSEFINKVKGDIPIVLLDRHYQDDSLCFVCSDNRLGAYLATKHLINMGHKSIACIQGNPNYSTVKDRVLGYQQALQESGLEEYEQIVGDSFTIECGYKQTKQLLQGENRPTAILSQSAPNVLGLLTATRELELQIPNDISVITFGDNFYMDFMLPPLSRIIQPIYDIGITGTQLLLEQMKTKDTSFKSIQLPTDMKLTNSVKRHK